MRFLDQKGGLVTMGHGLAGWLAGLAGPGVVLYVH
jgi:hypothetical protein